MSLSRTHAVDVALVGVSGYAKRYFEHLHALALSRQVNLAAAAVINPHDEAAAITARSRQILTQKRVEKNGWQQESFGVEERVALSEEIGGG